MTIKCTVRIHLIVILEVLERLETFSKKIIECTLKVLEAIPQINVKQTLNK